MNHTWGVYEVRGRLAGGTECAPNDRKAVAYFVRWRVDGTKRRRSFRTKSHAQTFRDLLLRAKLLGWPADERGWPIDLQAPAPDQVATVESADRPGRTIEQYIDGVWWPTISVTLADKSRLGHRRNADLAIDLLRLKEGDPRTGPGIAAGASIPLASWTSDDTKAALAARRRINGRTAARNQRLLDAAAADDAISDVTLVPEECSPATLRAFKITLGMIAKAAIASGEVRGDPMADTAHDAVPPAGQLQNFPVVDCATPSADVAPSLYSKSVVAPAQPTPAALTSVTRAPWSFTTSVLQAFRAGSSSSTGTNRSSGIKFVRDRGGVENLVEQRSGARPVPKDYPSQRHHDLLGQASDETSDYSELSCDALASLCSVDVNANSAGIVDPPVGFGVDQHVGEPRGPVGVFAGRRSQPDQQVRANRKVVFADHFSPGTKLLEISVWRDDG